MDALAQIREALGLGAGVVLSQDEIALGLERLSPTDAAKARAELDAIEPREPSKPEPFGGVIRG
jgi:hypothetical protein